MSQNPPELDVLLQRCKEGDEHAWTKLFDEYVEQIARWLARLDYSLNEHDIEDLLSEVFIKVSRTLGSYRADECPFRPWLYRQTESVIIDNRRRRQAQKRRPPGAILQINTGASQDVPVLDPPEQGATPDQAAVRNETHQMLFEALDALGPDESRCRRLIGFIYFGGFTYQEVGQALQMKAKTVSSALSKCMDHLREIARRVFSEGKAPTSPNL